MSRVITAEKAREQDAREGRFPSEYDVLCCISTDIAEASHGVENLMTKLGIDHNQAMRVHQLATKLTQFFTTNEIEAIHLLHDK